MILADNFGRPKGLGCIDASESHTHSIHRTVVRYTKSRQQQRTSQATMTYIELSIKLRINNQNEVKKTTPISPESGTIMKKIDAKNKGKKPILTRQTKIRLNWREQLLHLV